MAPPPNRNFHLSLEGSGPPDSSLFSAAADGTSFVSAVASAAASRTLALNIASGRMRLRKLFIDSVPVDNHWVVVGSIRKHLTILGDPVLLLAYRHRLLRGPVGTLGFLSRGVR